jgi:hypothetical protein
VHDGLIPGPRGPFEASSGGAVGALLTPGAAACEDHRRSCVPRRTSRPGTRRPAPSRQRSPPRHGRDIGRRGVEARRPKWPHPDTVAGAILGPSLRTHDGLERHGRTSIRVPTRCRCVALPVVPMVTIRCHAARDRDCSPTQALGRAPWGLPGRYRLRVRPLLITRAFEVHDPWVQCGSHSFPLNPQGSALPVGGEHGCGWRG